MARAWKVAPTDTVATMLDDARAGDTLTVDGAAGDAIGRAITLEDDIARGHKVALLPMGLGAPVLKYGFPIGHATAAIRPGAHVHSHNLSTALDATLDYRYAPVPAATLPQAEAPTFMGYRRADGRVAADGRLRRADGAADRGGRRGTGRRCGGWRPRLHPPARLFAAGR
jgi:altronate hydrolase